ncbi:MAG: hypothetical protein AWT59_2998 [Candidatus Gallionella acididurans]|uniref:Uncharacterized protein n=1 Tax=Candidatus Gallionella acididurans TaxID=1796491 RepID=A0A139BPI3_9PROT|nr:MAG: hypothetical protein AWT59_2998 [Candidatus Gallionella acididurans]
MLSEAKIEQTEPNDETNNPLCGQL